MSPLIEWTESIHLVAKCYTVDLARDREKADTVTEHEKVAHMASQRDSSDTLNGDVLSGFTNDAENVGLNNCNVPAITETTWPVDA